jgi:hypothetical protein
VGPLRDHAERGRRGRDKGAARRNPVALRMTTQTLATADARRS